MTIRGGSAHEPERGYPCPFFKAGIKAMELRTKDIYRFRFLPSFADIAMEDAAFKTSFISYRDANLDQDPATKTEGFTDWYFILPGYTWLGRQQKGFLSPSLSYKGQPHGGLDPIIDCRRYARQDPETKPLTERPKDSKGSAIIPDVRRWAFFNAYLERENSWENFILYMTQMGMDDLKDKLRIKGGRADAVITAEWPDYLYGDITDPMTGLIATAKKGYPKDNVQKIEATVVSFSKKPQSLDGAEIMAIDPNTADGAAILEGRYAIGDTDNVLKVPTYSEILEYIVADGTIPYDIIQRACGEFADVPSEPASARAASYSTPPDENEGADEVAPPAAPARPAAAPARTAAAPARTAPAAVRPAAAPATRTAAPTATAARPATNGKAAPATRTAAAPKSASPAKTATPPVKTHTALAATEPPAPEGTATEADYARFAQLTNSLTNNEQLSSDELTELTTLSKLCAGQTEAPADDIPY